MTRSSGCSPPVTTRKPSMTGTSVTYFGRATLSPSITSTNLRTCSVPMATSGTSSASAGAAAATWTRPNMPGVKGSIGVGELGAAANGARCTIDGVVEEVRLARVRKFGLVDELQCDRDTDAAVGGSGAIAAERG